MSRKQLRNWLGIPKRGYQLQRDINQGGVLLTVTSLDCEVYASEYVTTHHLVSAVNWRTAVAARLRRSRSIVRSSSGAQA